MSRVFRIKLWNDSGIPSDLREYCDKCGISVNAFVKMAIAEKLERMDVHSMTIAEIEEREKEYNNGK